jgi:OB-fold nucleic acid binding domain
MVAREGLTPRSQVRLLHGYTKQVMGGEVEFHLGSRASLQILRRSSEQITIGTPDTSVNFTASDILRIRLLRLQKSQSDKGPTWALCSDGSALLTVKFWDNQAQEILSFGEGSIVKIHNHWVTERNGMVYLNVGSKSTVERAAEGEVGGVPFSSIGAIKPGPVLWSISGKIIERGEPREIETREGRRTRVSNINLEDSSSRIRVSFWDAHAEKTESLRIGDSIRLVGIKVRENMNGEKEASTVFLTQLEKQ